MTATITRPANKLDFDVTVPAQLLWGAAQCASKDQHRGALHTVQIQLDCADNDQVKVTIRATNGHIAYRVACYCKGSADSLPETFMLKAEHLKKIPAGEKSISISRIVGELRVQGFKMGIRNDVEFVDYEYPNLDQLIPDTRQLGNQPGAPIGMNGGYLELIGKVAQRATDSGVVRMWSKSASSPVLFTTGDDPDSARFLLMPVWIIK